MTDYHLMPTEPVADADSKGADTPMQWPEVDAELLATLPPVLRAVVKALGFYRAGGWLAGRGGVSVVIPKFKDRALELEPAELDRLRVTLSPHLDAAGRVWLPKADKIFRKARDAQIRKDRNHTTIRALARRENLSDRQIVNICQGMDDGQGSLF